VEGDVVKVGIEAPSDVPVHRQEVYEEIQQCNQQALTMQSSPLPRLAGTAAGTVKPGASGGPAIQAARPAKNGKPASQPGGQFTRSQPQECPAVIVGRK
jgi:hypothetical protein